MNSSSIALIVRKKYPCYLTYRCQHKTMLKIAKYVVALSKSVIGLVMMMWLFLKPILPENFLR